MENNNGSFAGVLGNTPALQNAINRRGSTGGATNAVSQSSANFDPNAQPAAPVTAQSPASMPPQGGQSAGGGGLPMDSGESTIIIKALNERLRSLSKQAEGQMGI